MLCQSCGENDASIHFTKIINGDIEEKHLCENCAKIGHDFDLPFSFHKLFTGLIGTMEEDKQRVKDTLCLDCGLTYNKFLETGMFGCASCFHVFEEEVDSLLKGIHGHNRHIGKIPLRLNSKSIREKEIESLRMELKESIIQEEFEKAALLRDEIKMIKRKLDNSRSDVND